MTIRVLIVDDSAFMRKAVKRMLESDPGIEVVGLAADGAEGVRLARELAPDLITLDFKMPEMDGLQALKAILAQRPVPVLMLSSFTGEGAKVTLQALELGALDFIDKASVRTSMDIVNIAPQLLAKVRAIAGIPLAKIEESRHAAPVSPVPGLPVIEGGGPRPFDLVVIGSSTGGPSALQRVLSGLPAHYPYPLAIVQHMPPGFTRPLADRLNSICAIKVVEASQGDELRPGKAVIAAAGAHLLVRRRNGQLQCLLSNEPESLHRPSVDVLFASAVRATHERTIAVLLTGMGKDGAKGMFSLHGAGALTLVQDEATSVVWGMPRSALELKAVREVLPLAGITPRLLELASAPTARD